MSEFDPDKEFDPDSDWTKDIPFGITVIVCLLGPFAFLLYWMYT